MKKKNKNYHSHKLRSYIIVFGLLILSFAVVFGGLIFRSRLHPDYPLVFLDANNKLMVITKSNNSKNDIASITDTNIVYANNDTKYLLYTNNNSLYLLDTTIGGVGEKISSSVLSYGFSENDKRVYYIDVNHNFYLYSRNTKESELIAKNVNKVELVKDNYLIYNQSNKLIYQEIGQDACVIVDSYKTVELNNDNKLILYSTANGELKDYYIYDIATSSSSKILEGVTNLYSKDDNYTRFLYTKPTSKSLNISNLLKDELLESDKSYVSYKSEDVAKGKISKKAYDNNQKLGKGIEIRNQIRNYIKDYGKFGSDLYYQTNSKVTIVATNINKLYYYDIKNQVYSYTTYRFENNILNINDYDGEEKDIETFYQDVENSKLNSLYYKQGSSDSSLAYKNITTDAKVIIRNNNEYYLILSNNNYYDLYYSKINNRAIKSVVQIDNNMTTYKINIDYVRGYLYPKEKDDHYYLQLVYDGNVSTLVTDVNPDYYTVSEGKDSIYYLKKTGDYTNDLMIYNGIRNSKIESDIYSFLYINNDLIYVTKNYDSVTKTSDLYRLSNGHLDEIYKDIADWYSPLKEDKKDEMNNNEEDS